jgi:hypothetical protein
MEGRMAMGGHFTSPSAIDQSSGPYAIPLSFLDMKRRTTAKVARNTRITAIIKGSLTLELSWRAMMIEVVRELQTSTGE